MKVSTNEALPAVLQAAGRQAGSAAAVGEPAAPQRSGSGTV